MTPGRIVVKRLVMAMMALALCVTPLAAPGPARATEPDPAAGSAAADPVPDRWWGVAGALVCGAGLNLMHNCPPVIGVVPVVAATIGGCILAAMDVACE